MKRMNSMKYELSWILWIVANEGEGGKVVTNDRNLVSNTLLTRIQGFSNLNPISSVFTTEKILYLYMYVSDG